MMTAQRHYVTEVFTPTTPARLTFIERQEINDRLVDSLTTPGKQIIVYGHSGCGKTTLLINKLEQLYERHITTRCVAGMSFDQILADAFSQLGAFYEAERRDSANRSVSLTLSAEYSVLKGELRNSRSTTSSSTSKVIAPPSLTPQALGRFMGIGKYCWVLEDFHKIGASEKKQLAQMMKVFMDMADEYRQLRIVAVGAVDTARQVVEYDPEMRRRVSEILVPLMTPTELQSVMKKGEDLLNIRFPFEVRDGVVTYSNGLASVCHQLALNICNAANIKETVIGERNEIPSDILESAVTAYMEEASDTFKAAFDKARRVLKKSKFDNVNLIFRALIEHAQEGATLNEIKTKVLVWEPAYPDSNLHHFLSHLQTPERGEVIRHDSASGRYSFSDPVYRVFATTLFKQASDFRVVFSLNWDRLISETAKMLSSTLIRQRLERVQLESTKENKQLPLELPDVGDDKK